MGITADVILKMLILPMLIKMLSATRRPLLTATFYAAIILTNSLIFSLMNTPARTVALQLAATWALAAVVFSTLHALDDTPFYWPALVGGVLVLMFVL